MLEVSAMGGWGGRASYRRREWQAGVQTAGCARSSRQERPTTTSSTLDAARTALGRFSICWGQRESARVTWVGSVDTRETRACAPIRRPEQRRVGLHHRTSLPSNEWLPSTACAVCQYCAIHGAHPRAPVCLLRVHMGGRPSEVHHRWIRVFADASQRPIHCLRPFVARAAVTDGVTSQSLVRQAPYRCNRFTRLVDQRAGPSAKFPRRR